MSNKNFTKVVVTDKRKNIPLDQDNPDDYLDLDDHFDDYEDRWANKNQRKVKVLKFRDSRSL